VGAGPLGWWGLSMGTIIGLPLVAAEPRIGAAVLGLMGLTGPTRDRIAADAPRVSCPVLFLSQWHDELFPRESSVELFDLIGAADKRLLAHVGRHGEVPAEAFEASERFLVDRLPAHPPESHQPESHPPESHPPESHEPPSGGHPVSPGHAGG
jgi:hypothetical protein